MRIAGGYVRSLAPRAPEELPAGTKQEAAVIAASAAQNAMSNNLESRESIVTAVADMGDRSQAKTLTVARGASGEGHVLGDRMGTPRFGLRAERPTHDVALRTWSKRSSNMTAKEKRREAFKECRLAIAACDRFLKTL